jgi:hypothetical protein
MIATTNAPRAEWAQPVADAPVAGSIEDLGRQLLAETNAARCVAYRRSRSGQLIWQRELEAAEVGLPAAATPAEEAAAAGRASVQITRPVRDAFGQIIGVIQTRETSDPTF